jgi:hypothetical protein
VGRQEEPEGEKSVDVHMLGQQGGVETMAEQREQPFLPPHLLPCFILIAVNWPPGLECRLRLVPKSNKACQGQQRAGHRRCLTTSISRRRKAGPDCQARPAHSALKGSLWRATAGSDMVRLARSPENPRASTLCGRFPARKRQEGCSLQPSSR